MDLNYPKYAPYSNGQLTETPIMILSFLMLLILFIIGDKTLKEDYRYKLGYLFGIASISFISLPLAMILIVSYCVKLIRAYRECAQVSLIVNIQQATKIRNSLNMDMLNSVLKDPIVDENRKINILEKILESDASAKQKYDSAMILCKSKQPTLVDNSINAVMRRSEHFNNDNFTRAYKGLKQFMNDEQKRDWKNELKNINK
jgi:hypothetical protein